MIVTPHDINFMMGFIKEEELFSTASNASNDSLSTIIASARTIHHVRYTLFANNNKKQTPMVVSIHRPKIDSVDN